MSLSRPGIAPQIRAPFNLSVRGLFWLPVGIAAAVVAFVLGALVVASWHGLARIEPIQTHLEHIGQLQDLVFDMEQLLFSEKRSEHQIFPEDVRALRDSLEGVAGQGMYLDPQTPSSLQRIQTLLADEWSNPVDGLFDALAQLRGALEAERSRLYSLTDKVARDTRTERNLSLVLVGVLPLVGLAALLVLRGRVQRPLASLGDLLARLAERDYRPIPDGELTDSASMVQPAFRSYNDLVHRLQDLEAEHNDREHTLEQEVRQATEALLTQSRQLARAERLAAVGAISAGLAHELRNPLAGIQMACTKLRRSIGGSDRSARLDAVISELKRLNRLLSERVDAARHAPEPLTPVRLKPAVEDFLSLVRYQVPQGVRLISSIPDDLVCRLPEDGLRQALLNLVLNAAQTMVQGHGQVEITAVREGATVALRVSDTGPGFPAEMLTMGVRPFASGRMGGTGLGLAMVRRFTEDVHAVLVLENLEPHGARVTLRLPYQEAPAEDLHRGSSDA
jgi:C4-dicarboxylate-specific signal transduction histidine kinase